jgi:uncharacterized Rossmann fold enzyme
MEETVTEEEREFKVTHEDGSQSVIKGKIVNTDHGVTDEDGNPKISTHIALEGPIMPVHVLSGEND